jgi:hypothetical protein
MFFIEKQMEAVEKSGVFKREDIIPSLYGQSKDGMSTVLEFTN